MNRRAACAIVTLPVALATFHAAGQGVAYHTVVMAGQGAPGLPGLPGVTFDSASEPRISPHGTIAFWATLTGTGITSVNDGSIWVVHDGVPALVYQEGAPAFGTTGTLGGLASMDLNEAGRVAFTASIFEAATPNAPTNVAYFAETDAGVSLLVREPAATQVLSTLIPFSGAGQVAWSTGTTIASTFQPSVTTTTPVPGISGVVFRKFAEPALGDGGDIVFRAGFAPTPSSVAWRWGLFTLRNGTLATLAATGDVAVGLPAGTTWGELGGTPALGPSGEVITWALVQNAALPGGKASGIFHEQGGQLAPIVMTGDPAAEVSGATYASFARRVGVTASGGIVFNAFLNGATPGVDNSGMFIAEPGQPVHLFVRRGQVIAGAPAQSVVNVLGEAHVGGDAIVAFTGFLKGPGIVSGSEHALFVGDTRVGPRILLQAGTPFVIPGGNVRTIRSISFDSEGAETGRSQMMGGRTLLVQLTFTDRSSGLFSATLPCTSDFDGDGSPATDQDIEAFFACLAGSCCSTCASADFNGDGDVGTDADIDAFFRVMAGGAC
jgi:hypothetical protein